MLGFTHGGGVRKRAGKFLLRLKGKRGRKDNEGNHWRVRAPKTAGEKGLKRG